MTWFTRHPGDRELNRFADGELGEHELVRINGHLAGCPRCREDVGLIRRMGEAAGSLPAPIATEEVLRRALARRAAGERVLLPSSDAGAVLRRPVNRFAPAAIAALLTLMIASLVVSVRVLEADRPALRIYPERPEAGEALTVEYHGTALFSDQTHLKLRARYRTAQDRHWQLLAGVLIRGDDGLYRTEVPLPDSVVYAAFAVEDMDGERVDSNNRELWDVMVHEDGAPTLDAMMGRLRDLERRDWGEAYQQSVRMTDAYPDAPQSWAARYSFEMSLFDQDSVATVHQAQFERLERIIADAPRPNPEDVAWLGLYGLTLGEAESGEIWIRNAAQQDPYNHAVLEAQMVLWAQQAVEDPSAMHQRVNALWPNLPAKSDNVANLGWQVALEAGDPQSAQIWFSRYLSLRPDEALNMAPRAYQMGDGVVSVRDWIEDQVATIEVARPLHLASDQYRRLEAGQRQRLFASMAVEAYRSGDESRAGRLAEDAVDLGWESRSLVDLARVLIETNRSESALRTLARAAVDPMTASLAQGLLNESSVNTLGWGELTRDAERQIRSHVMDGAVIRYLDTSIPLASSTASSVRLAELLDHRVTVLVFMSRLCAPAIREVPRIAQLARDLDVIDAQLVVINIDEDDHVEALFRDSQAPVLVYSDPSGAARAELLSSFTPDYFILDSEGRVRFEHSGLDEVLRQAQTIQSTLNTALTAED